MSRLRQARLGHGWSQAELAARSGLPRASVGAIEAGRHVPSVRVALALASALDTTVEQLFARIETGMRAAGRIEPGTAFWAAEIDGRVLAFPTELLRSNFVPPDATMDSELRLPDRAPVQQTLVIASCDPMVGLLEHALAARGVRLISLLRTSTEALEMLARGEVHAAGLHFASSTRPGANRTALSTVDPDTVLLSYADWDTGLAFGASGSAPRGKDVSNPKLRWAHRPAGAAANRVIEDLGGPAQPAKSRRRAAVARDHVAVVDAIDGGFADAGVTLRPIAEARALAFLSVELARYDLALPRHRLSDPRIKALIEVTSDRSFRAEIDRVPGVSAERMGELIDAP